MKTRLITAAVGILIAIFALWKIFTPFFGIIISAFTLIATYEIQHVAGVKSKSVIGISVVFSALVPQYIQYADSLPFKIPTSVILSIYVLIMLTVMIIQHNTVKFEHIAISLYASVFIPYAISNLILLRDTYMGYNGIYSKKEAFYFVVFGLLCAWLTDSFAFFVGRKLGKHKLCPSISPKKTVEGAIGGLVLSVLFNVLVFFGFNKLLFDNANISYLFVSIMALLLSAISMLGDLSASIIKRNYGAKDFGNIMPGHGGVMDRFDSCIFVLPALYAAINIINA